ncbi:MAG: TonB-dependent receptor [Porphyrobacter sp.]|nr:TonB-dependent receptor [Porphyrobacter sp.]
MTARKLRLAPSNLAVAATLGFALAAAPAFAQEAPAKPQAQPAQDQPATADDEAPQDDVHNRQVDYQGNIIVTAAGLKQLDLLAGTTAVEGLALQRTLGPQLGDVLINQPGVSMSGFAPGASRPVLRGFSGERVKLLIDGIGSIDASNLSEDHAVAIDPFNAERVDVLRGPAVLLYGSQAIGGAVNVTDKRIPLRVPSEPVHVDAIVSGNTVADLRQGAASIDAPVGTNFAVHVDGSYLKSGDITVPGFTVAPALRADLLDRADAVALSDPTLAAALREQASQSGTLPGSGTRTYSATGGFAFFNGDSNIGASLGYYDTFYGIPVRPGTDETEPGNIGLKQWRGDLRAELDLGSGFFERLNTRAAFSNYTHTEFEADGAPGTTFNVNGIEARAELVQADRSGWSGSLGVQYDSTRLATDPAGEFLPRYIASHIAGFVLQEVPLGSANLQLAGRYESAQISAPDLGFDRTFGTASGALGLSYPISGGVDIGFNANRVARAPSAEELLVDGYHDATQTYERGDPALEPETAIGGEVFVRGRAGIADLSLTGFYNRFSNYIYEAATGEVIEGAPVFQYFQSDADYYGVESEVDLAWLRDGDFSLTTELRGSYVRARLADGTNVPRIPPLTLYGAIDAELGAVSLRGEVAWNDRQDKTGPGETPTDGYTMVNASIGWRPFRGDDNVSVLLKANNIFDVTGRLATSLTKDYTPLPGRNFEVSLRVSF